MFSAIGNHSREFYYPCRMDNDPSRGFEAETGKRLGMARTDLRRVARARKELDKALAERRASILAAVASGETYRDVARMAGISHQRVAQIVRTGVDE
jgi:DNA-binding NarL/FixJ family response regulator